MPAMIDWARDVLLARGALVETDQDGALRAMLSPELAGALSASEWLSLRFGAGAGADDENTGWSGWAGCCPPMRVRSVCGCAACGRRRRSIPAQCWIGNW